MLIDFEKAVYYLFRKKKKRIDSIKALFKSLPSRAENTYPGERERTDLEKKRPLNILKMKEGHCHLEGEARVASHQVKQEKDFNNYPTLPVLIILFIWRTEVTLIHSLF